MKAAVKIMLLMPLAMLVGCSPSAEDMLVGRWKQEMAIERLSNETTGEITFDTLPGFDTREMTFLSDATCMMADRGDTVHYQWSLTGGNMLVLWREGWAEDYTVNKLTKQRLVYSDSYTYYDSITGNSYNYKYRFEYKKL